MISNIVQKMKDLSKTCGLTGKQFDDFRQKGRTETTFSTFQKDPVEHMATIGKYRIGTW